MIVPPESLILLALEETVAYLNRCASLAETLHWPPDQSQIRAGSVSDRICMIVNPNVALSESGEVKALKALTQNG
jgi:hypothetical protein